MDKQIFEDHLDEVKLGKRHLKTMLITGVGFFTDAYDLFIIGVAVSVIAPLWHLNNVQIGLVGSTSLIAAFLGSTVFGRIGDKFGRRTIYGIEAIIITASAILSAFSPNFIWLIAARFFLGFGIGGDYPLSAVIMSEYSNRKDRGKLVGLVFSMQAAGLVFGPLVAYVLLSSSMPLDLSWRLMLGLGAIPSGLVIYLRRKIPESPRYAAHVLGDAEVAAASLNKFSGAKVDRTEIKMKKTKEKKSNFSLFLKNRKYMLTLFGTAGSWFLMDYAYYGNTISTPIIMGSIAPHMSLQAKALTTLLIFSVFAVPGYIASLLLIDKIGRKSIQFLGFAVMGTAFLLTGLIPEITQISVLFIGLYGISYFFTEFGPNFTTFVMPSELFPTEYRTTGHGFSAGIAKFGAFLGVLLFPTINSFLGIRGTFIFVSIFAFAGIITTMVLDEPKGKSLENLTEEKVFQ